MKRTCRKKRLLACVVCLAALTVAFGCAPQAPEEKAQADEPAATAASLEPEYDLFNPIIETKEDGTVIQRTPADDYSASYDSDASYRHPQKNVPYNTYYLKADARGCNACHEDLASTIRDGAYEHNDLRNNLGIELTVQQCLDCHSEGPGYQTIENSFGTIIHGIHETDEKAECWNCHNATNDSTGMQLWDVVKHDQLRGITPVENVEGDFSFNQEDTLPASDIFEFNWQYHNYDYERQELTESNAPLDEKKFEDWTITISGAVDQEVTFKLTDLIEKVESKTLPMKMHCTYNPIGGPLITNSTVTGIPLQWLLDQAGLSDDAVSFSACSAEGLAGAGYLSSLEGREALLVYEIDGEPLSWKNGYPVQLWIGGIGAPVFCKQVSDIMIGTEDEEVYEYDGWARSDGGWYNKPNIGFFNLVEGQVIPAGQPYTVKGYADAWDDPIVAVEFSMDGGNTWTRYETPNTNVDRWVSWEYTLAPEEGTYVLRARSVTESGLVTEEPLEKLFNVQAA